MAPIKAKEYVTLGFSYEITEGLSEPGWRSTHAPPPQVFGRSIITLYALSQPGGQIMPNLLLRAPPFHTHTNVFSDFPRALREILYSTSDPTTLYKEVNTYSEHTI